MSILRLGFPIRFIKSVLFCKCNFSLDFPDLPTGYFYYWGLKFIKNLSVDFWFYPTWDLLHKGISIVNNFIVTICFYDFIVTVHTVCVSSVDWSVSIFRPWTLHLADISLKKRFLWILISSFARYLPPR